MVSGFLCSQLQWFFTFRFTQKCGMTRSWAPPMLPLHWGIDLRVQSYVFLYVYIYYNSLYSPIIFPWYSHYVFRSDISHCIPNGLSYV
jgi:hypothetical protein